MKRYKLKRKQDEFKKKNPKKFQRNDKMLKLARKMALDDFSQDDFEYDSVLRFGSNFYRDIKHEVNIQYADAQAMYLVYKRCIKVLKQNKQKAEYLNKTYIPLEDDLFNV
jgi:hypothetical protein